MPVLGFYKFIFVCNTLVFMDLYGVVCASACSVFSAPNAVMAPVSKLWLQL